MCGIAGKVGNNAGYRTSIEVAVNSISHRGPDEQGYFVAPGVELGIARLAIIDVKQLYLMEKYIITKRYKKL